MLSGIGLGLGQAMGMHSDDTYPSFGPIEAEVRRRVWWSLCQLDNRISEDCGLESHVPFAMNTQLPLHINDTDLDVRNNAGPIPRAEFTEMTLSLVKIEAAKTSLRIKRLRYEDTPSNREEIERLARAQIDRFEKIYEKYLDSDSEVPRLRIAYLGLRLITVKLWKLVYDVSAEEMNAGKDEMKAHLLLYHADVLEITHQLPDRSSQFGWFVRCKYT